jgi:hypothetical protein
MRSTRGTVRPHGPGDEGVGHVGRADAEGHAAQRAAVRRVRIGARHQLPGQRVVLGHHRVRDAGDVAAVVRAGFVLGERAMVRSPCSATKRRCASHIARRLGSSGEPACAGLSSMYEVWSSNTRMDAGLAQRQRRAEGGVQHVGAMPV